MTDFMRIYKPGCMQRRQATWCLIKAQSTTSTSKLSDLTKFYKDCEIRVVYVHILTNDLCKS